MVSAKDPSIRKLSTEARRSRWARFRMGNTSSQAQDAQQFVIQT